jgi:galactofuranosylgalactofuranosylrhamnosyl-N-acetylglucosaminyl-diphospho-decaprenol beta-1,5/1,6-galactofuranosyltransferase
MRLQSMPFASIGEESPSLYYRKKGNVTVQSGKLIINEGTVTFDTYFGMFSVEKWKKYTLVNEILLNIRFQGKFNLEVCSFNKNEVISSFEIETDSEKNLEILLPNNMPEIIYIKISGNGTIYAASYYTNDKKTTDVKLAIDICTYKREEYLKNNLIQIKKDIFDDKENFISLKVFVIDNGNTLKFTSDDEVSLFQNSNVGGTGGFTRGMIEAIQEENFTHVLIMDDDAKLNSEAIRRTYAILSYIRSEFDDYSIGGAWLRLDYPNIQFERGAKWNLGKIEAEKHNLDLSKKHNLIINESDEKVDYNGWWYTCVPVKVIDKVGYPLPVFIHMDDIEYGIRTGSKFIYYPGISIWHEIYEAKMSGVNEYYNVRNLAILNSIHYKEEFTATAFKKVLFKYVSSNIARFRYRYVELNITGANDFLKGPSFLQEESAVKLNSMLRDYCYDTVDADSLIGKLGITADEVNNVNLSLAKPKHTKFQKLMHIITANGTFLPADKEAVIMYPSEDVHKLFRSKRAVNIDGNHKATINVRSNLSLFKEYIKLFREFFIIDNKFKKASLAYNKYYKQLTTEDFWVNYFKQNI